MRRVFKIEGKHKLNGTVRISGSKNATVALIPAAILSKEGPVTICDVPNISDVDCLTILLKELNIEVFQNAQGHLIIDPTNMKNTILEHNAVTKLRASYYFMGALLGKYKDVKIRMSGGCYLGPRPIDLHLKGFEALGATVDYDRGLYHIYADELIGDRIYLDIASVGATINIMMAAVYAKGRTIIDNAAKEPEIIDVATMLNKMGARIRGAGTATITIDGVESLTGCFHEIIPDRIEAGTFLIMAAAAGEDMVVENIIPQHLESLLSKLKEMNVDMEVNIDSVRIHGGSKMKAVDIQTQTYPGFATDLQQPLTALLTQAEGISTVRETIYAERFKHCPELNRMGANIIVNIPSSTIAGPTPLYGVEVTATDLRCGASLVAAALMADGVTTIYDIEHIERGYENLDGKLNALGAKMWKEEVE
ncbi:MAG: UDP-N-acetylglucosamine 1-carboxyvinyltransferase [Erysipelotrichaceae bacterium]|nr:UDP-N-acetylglucosamine 1-carboxyvinyltransferase [Erysipelotrichaceae bacterium]